MASSNSKQLIGLSLAECVRDIASGEVPLSDVRCIITSSRITDDDWSDAINDYKRFNEWGRKEEKIFETLLGEGRIEQPRIEINNYPKLKGNKLWVSSRYDIEWEYDHE